MQRLKKMLNVSPPPLSPAEAHFCSLEDRDATQDEIESLLIGMFRDLPQKERQTILDIVTEIYSLAKRSTC